MIILESPNSSYFVTNMIFIAPNARVAAYEMELLHHVMPTSRVKNEPTAVAIKEASKFTFFEFDENQRSNSDTCAA